MDMVKHYMRRIRKYAEGLDPMVIYLYVKKQRNQGDMIIGVQTEKDTAINEILAAYEENVSIKKPLAHCNLNEINGTIAHDSSENGNNALVSGAVWVNGKFSNGLFFDGINDKLTFPSSTTLNLKTEFTIVVWVKATLTSGYRSILSKRWNAGNPRIFLFIDNYGHKFTFDVGNTNGQYGEVVGTLSDTNWHFIVAQWKSGENIKLVIDSTVFYGNTIAGTIEHPSTIVFGNMDMANENIWNGILDEIRIYDRIITQAEIDLLYTQNREFYNLLDARTNVLSLLAWRELYYMGYKTRQKVVLNE